MSVPVGGIPEPAGFRSADKPVSHDAGGVVLPPEADRRLASICWTIVASLGSFLCLTQLGMMLSLLAGRVATSAVIPVALIGSLLIGDRLAARSGRTLRERLCAHGSMLGLLAVTLVVAAWYFDLSVDGQWYHQTAIFAIARDWNPLADPMRAFPEHLHLWVRHYAKGTWYFAAALYDLTGNIELGKCQDGLAFGAMALAVFAAGLDWGLSRARSAMIAALVTLNPVATSVLTAYLVETVLTSFLTVAIAATFSGFRRAQPVVIVAGVAAAIVTINTKLTGLVYIGILLAAAGAWCLWQRRDSLRAYVGLAAATLVLGAVVFGYNPYVTNTVHRHHPFYPVKGTAAYPSLEDQGKEGIELYETPKNLIGRNRFVRLAYATFGRPSNAPYVGQNDAEFMWPFTARWEDLTYYRYHETRVAGFGPWFSGAILFSLLLGAWVCWKQPRGRAAFAVTALALTGTLSLSVHSWWARYSPHIWLLALVPVVFAFWQPDSRRMSRVVWLAATLFLINGATVAAVRMVWETRASRALREQLTELRADGRPIEVGCRFYVDSVPERLKAWGIPFTRTRWRELLNETLMVGIVEGYPESIAVHYRRAPQSESGAGSGSTSP